MQTLMIFWSSWRLEMIVSERQQDPPSHPLLVPSKVGQIRLLIRKSLWLVPYLSCHSLKQRDSSISLNKLATIPLHNYLTPSWGFFSCLLVLGCLVRTPLVLARLWWSELSSWATLGPFEPELTLWYFLWFYVGPKCACNLHISSKIQFAFSKR